MRTRFAIAVLVAASAARIPAQSSEQAQDQPRPTFRTEANYVRVDMYATVEDQPVVDLTPEEIQILEDGAPQQIATFEYVKVRPAGPQDTRIEPSTVTQSRQAAADPRARVFVIFLDTHHVRFEGAVQTRKAVVQFLDRVIGQDDLVGVMTPEMSAADVAFGRKTTVISKMLDDTWTWGRREKLLSEDPRERMYENCFGQGPAAELIARRREKLTFDALQDLITHLAGVREERKAVLTISEGWQLLRPNPALRAGRPTPGLGRDPIYVGPDGKLRRGVDTRNTNDEISMGQCEADRANLAEWDAVTVFNELFGRANRGNVSFYTVDTRGLAASYGSAVASVRTPAPAGADGRALRASLDSLRSLAENTDGIAVQDTNAVDTAMRRIVSDLTSYYLIGYYSSNSKLDGRFREISVRVKRPGVRVRARRGYRAATAEDLSTAATGAKEAPPTPIATAFEAVSAVSPRSVLRIRAAAWNAASAGTSPATALWLVGELDAAARKNAEWSTGATADVVMTSRAGAQVAAKTIELAPGLGDFAVRLPAEGGLTPGEYAVRVRVKPKQEGSLSVSDTARVIVAPEPPQVGEAVLWRRGPRTGPRYAMTADLRFQRSERLRVEHATTVSGTATARLLDRGGKTINVPVQVTERADDSGAFRWLSAELALAPLAPGDYAVEVTLGGTAAITAFKVVP